jgi:hypothetical protein
VGLRWAFVPHDDHHRYGRAQLHTARKASQLATTFWAAGAKMKIQVAVAVAGAVTMTKTQ